MPAILNLKTRNYCYVFIHDKKTFLETGFKSEKAALEAENEKRNELSKTIKVVMKERQLNQIIAALYKAANTIDIVFPSLIPELVRSYETLSAKRFRPSVVNWMNPDNSGKTSYRSGEDFIPSGSVKSTSMGMIDRFQCKK